ncbi:hypothetical protein Tsubulata_003950 [Turnera subulata]|uniref:Uncharacterized protein n=1 Tax=Turnera subulata TaxID=218843 RepID=A0A9Q0GD47_9ROSI|nr:hypothetical protein Tsubulata_003950 [Turnera subulata]
MAQFTAQGRLKLLLSNDGVQFKLVGSGSVNGSGSFHVQRGKLGFLGSSTRRQRSACLSRRHFYVHASSASVSEGINGEREDESESDLERDDLSCFRGLVLDIAYRPVSVVCWKRAICLEFMEKVTACVKCNSNKGHRTVEEANMKLLKVPKPPQEYDILAVPLTSASLRMLQMRKGTPEEWRQYLSQP